MFLTVLAAALAATTPAIEMPKPDPAKEQVAVCTVMIMEKMQSVVAGGAPVSIIVPLYTAGAGLSDEDAAAFQKGCDLYEAGFLMALQMQATAPASKAAMDDDRGTPAPDHSNDPR